MYLLMTAASPTSALPGPAARQHQHQLHHRPQGSIYPHTQWSPAPPHTHQLLMECCQTGLPDLCGTRGPLVCTPAAMVEVVWWWLPPPSIVHASDSSTPAPDPAAAADTHQHQAASRDSYISTLYWAHTTLPFVSVNILTLQPGLLRPN